MNPNQTNSDETAPNDQNANEPKNKIHKGINGKLLSDFEMLVTYKPGNFCKNQTFRGDKTLEQYEGYNLKFPGQAAALLYKFSNIAPRVQSAWIYDNTSSQKRVVRAYYDKGKWETNTL